MEYQARLGDIILLYEEETVVWRFALPRAGWWRKAQRVRLRTRPLSPSQMKRDEGLKRHTWLPDHSWSRITSGVLLNVIGAVHYVTSKVFSKLVPHFDAQELRQYSHQVMAIFQKTEQEVVMVVDRSGGAALLEHYVCVISPVADESLSPDVVQVMSVSVRWPWRSGLHDAA